MSEKETVAGCRPALGRTVAKLAGLFAVAVFVVAAGATAQVGTVAGDRATLVALYDATGRADWVNSTNWLSEAGLADWRGVTVGADGRVSQLTLGWNNLRGELPAELADASPLRSLVVANNDLTGSIPAELGEVETLEYLTAGGNDLSGDIPEELADATSLRNLRLGFNRGLSGSLPSGLADLELLVGVDIHGTGVCVPEDDGFQEWVSGIQLDSSGLVCNTTSDHVVDLAMVYTPDAAVAAGGKAAIEADIDLMVTEAKEIFADSGIGRRSDWLSERKRPTWSRAPATRI